MAANGTAAVPLLSVSPTVLSQERLDALMAAFRETYPKHTDKPFVFSAAGRTEISGNHTDHQNGRVVAAGIDLSAAMACVPSGTSVFKLVSKGWDPVVVDLASLDPVKSEEGTTASLIRGVAQGLSKKGYKIAGLDAVASSTVLPGSGLSSSAAFEVLITYALMGTLNDPLPAGAEPLNPSDVAIISQWAENVHFGKPCGLMDQMASAHGSVVAIDFGTKPPKVEKLPFDLASTGYVLVIVNSGGSHADLTPEYSAIRSEMNSVAKWVSGGRTELLGECNADEFLGMVRKLRESGVSDRAILRALHFFEECGRVDKIAELLRTKPLDMPAFLDTVLSSGRSSAMYLQNLHAESHPEEQPVGLALAMTEQFLSARKVPGKHPGAYRVHGGGFAGTIQAYIPKDILPEYIEMIEGYLGKGKVMQIAIRAESSGRVMY
ncbi:ribosomal protein S5 domain 2-type protein [Hyaloraphidium curvatum]|nr:ribosomal protein S5 domain 2-type protein [Hyaloraphidium curvatum]